MVTRISSGTSPTGAVYYNEEKVSKGKAERLAIRNYGFNIPLDQLRLPVIAAKLEDYASGNMTVKKPTFHASLSLAQGEKPLPTDLMDMADKYMKGMGYAGQPYIVYQHHDTDHTHIHIVSVRVDDNGAKIPDNYERERSNSLRKQLEKEFNLQVAEKASLKPERVLLQPLEYGKGDLKRELATVVNSVLKDFTFSSFSQFNQLLSLYNVKATEIPMEGKKPGLVYSIMDAQKVSQGAPYRSSSLPLQPTMNVVNRRINAGKKIKGDRVMGVRKVAAEHLAQSTNWDEFQQRLSKTGIEVIPHLGKGNNLFGVSFIDVRRQGIYTGSELGKAFTAGSLKATLGETYQPPSKRELMPAETTQTREQQIKQSLPEQRHQKQSLNQNEDHKPMQNIDLIRQLLYAAGQDVSLDENEQKLKKMLKKSRKPRLS